MTAQTALAHRPVLTDRVLPIPSLARDLTLVALGTAALTLIAQVSIPLPFTPVPLTLGTFGALLVGASLGPARGIAATGLYALLAAFGAPVLAGWSSSGLLTASFGYVIGYVLAGAALGYAARRGADRSAGRTAIAAIGATALVYVAGLPWLAFSAGLGLADTLAMGLLPFIVGDVIKAVAASALLPGAWALLGEKRRD